MENLTMIEAIRCHEMMIEYFTEKDELKEELDGSDNTCSKG